MTPEAKFSGVWKGSGTMVTVNIPLILFEEDETKIAYCPALDVYGYGDTEAESIEAFKVSLGEFFHYTLNKKTLRQLLKELGWTLKKSKTKPMIPPSFSSLINSNDDLNRLINNKPFKTVNQPIAIPS